MTLGALPMYRDDDVMSASTTPARRKAKPGTAGPRSGGRLQRVIDAAATREIEAALRDSGGNVVQAAAALGISQPGLYKRMNTLVIDPSKFRR